MMMYNILSLFDGMGCGMLAFKKAGIAVDNYYAYEIDKYAIQTTTHNFPQIQECGDVFDADFTQYKGINYLIGGSPCTYWSIAQSSNKRETTASGFGWKLFSQYVRALHEAKPKYFIYENNKSMSKAIRESISETFGFEPIMINSALVSAQNRQRLYWVGNRNDDGTYSKVNVEQPKDKGILLKNILDLGMDLTTNNKSYTLTASYNGAVTWNTIERSQRNMVAEPVNVTADGKTYKVYEVKDGQITIKDKQYPIKLQDGYYIIRKLTVTECKRLQTVPEWYEFPVSNTQAYKMLGNGWTVDVIVHLINATQA